MQIAIIATSSAGAQMLRTYSDQLSEFLKKNLDATGWEKCGDGLLVMLPEFEEARGGAGCTLDRIKFYGDQMLKMDRFFRAYPFRWVARNELSYSTLQAG